MNSEAGYWVPVFGPRAFTESFCVASNGEQHRYRFDWIDTDRDPVPPEGLIPSGPLHFDPGEDHRPFYARKETGVTVSTSQVKPFSDYLGVPEERYLLLGAQLGLTQWRALVLNNLMNAEDFLHEPGVPCIYAAPGALHEYLLLLESPRICEGCRDFYHCLGADEDLALALDLIRRFPGTELLDTTP